MLNIYGNIQKIGGHFTNIVLNICDIIFREKHLLVSQL